MKDYILYVSPNLFKEMKSSYLFFGQDPRTGSGKTKVCLDGLVFLDFCTAHSKEIFEMRAVRSIYPLRTSDPGYIKVSGRDGTMHFCIKSGPRKAKRVKHSSSVLQ
jgi:hypothetical protein